MTELTPWSGPASSEATVSTRPLARPGPVERGSIPSWSGAPRTWDYGPAPGLFAYDSPRDGSPRPGPNPATARASGATAANTAGTATVSNHTKDVAWRLGAGYQLDWPAGATTLSVLVEALALNQDKAAAGAVKKYDRMAWQVALKHRIKDHELRARYSEAQDGTVTLSQNPGGSSKDYGATLLALGYAYYFAPSFQVYLHYAKITNRPNAQYTFIIGGSSAVAGATPKGADPSAVGLGVRYAF